jgi:hypothetical protein
VIFRLQDPGATEGYLLESMLELAKEADAGGGSFAWASSTGVDLLAGDDVFQEFLGRGSFELVVGVDWVTDEQSVARLTRYAESNVTFSVRAFVHDLRPIIFHPKYAWFRRGGEVTLICGSGNLTRGGLLGNWEAFSQIAVRGEDADQLEQAIRLWVDRWAEYLLPLDDARVLERARRNNGREELPILDQPGGGDEKPAPMDEESLVLVTEIPGQPGSPRWSQANFRQQDYLEFFGAQIGSQRRIVLYHVGRDGTLGGIESRPNVDVESSNYRFELGAATHLEYPHYQEVGRPIGVFVRLADRTFIYMLLMPGTATYDHVSAILEEYSQEPEGNMRRGRMTAVELRELWPDAPLWRVEIED